MTELRKKMRRSLAGILAFCVIFTSIPGIAWADELPEFDEDVLTREEVMASAELKLIPEDTPIPYSELTEKAQNAIRTTEPVTLSQLGQISTGQDREYYSDLFSGDVFRAGQYGDPDTTCVVVFVKPVEKLENYSEYTITGSEKYVFLYVNKTEQDYNMKINIDGYNAKIVTVPSANTVSLLNKKKASPSNSEAVSVNGGGSAVTESGIKNEELTGEEEKAAEETTTAEDTSIEDSSEGEITKETEEETVNSTEPESAEETSGPEETPAHESADETKGADETVSVDETVAETAAPETDSVDNETGSVEPTDSEPVEIRSESSDNGVESELDIVASLSRSPHTVPIVGVPVAGEVYEGEAKSPEEEYNLMRGLPADYEEDEDEEDVYAYTDDSAQEDQIADYSAAVMILTGLLEKEETASPSVATRSSIPRSFYRRSSEVVAVGASEEIVETVAEASGGTFDVSFYDYASAGIKNSPNKDILGLDGDNQKKLLIGNQYEERNGKKYPTHGNQNLWIGHILGVASGKDNIVMQGIAKDKYDENGKIQFNYVTGPIFGKSGAGSNPDMDGIQKYEKINVIEEGDNRFFVDDEDGNFVFDSSSRKAALIKKTDSSNKTTYTLQGSKGGNGFWPLNGYNNKNNPTYNSSEENTYFGMTLSFDFVLPEYGQITTSAGQEKDMVFEFTGDDDVWVYLRKAGSKEGRLALDLGGIHGASGGQINFASGLITHNTVWTGNTTGTKTKAVYWYLYDDKNVGENVGDHKISKVVGLPRDVWEEYTLDFYYMERGAGQSNCKIKANMPTIPKDKVAVYKSVAGDTEESRFKMNLQIKRESGSWETIESKWVEKNKKVEFSTELPEKTEYRVVEEGTSAPVTSWKIGDETREGLESPTGIVGTNNLAVCFNNYDFAPSISKNAVQEQEEQDLYWISLGITGNSTVQETIEGDASSEKTFYIDTVGVEDILTKWVNFELNEDVPQMKLELKKSGESNFTELAVQVEKTAEGKYRIVYKEHEIAVIEGKTIKWNAVNPSYGFGKFDENSTVVLSYLVRVSEDADYKESVSEYPDQAGSDTGTHSGENGYYSNVKATAEYTTELVKDPKTLTFKKPVVRPLKPEGSLTITKEVDSELAEAAGKTFDFTVELSNIKVKNFKAGMSGDLQTMTANTDGSVSLSFSLKDGESYEITGLNKETTYKVVEGLYSDIRFYSNLNNISVTKNGLADGSGVNVSNRSAEGTLTDTAGSRTEYYYKTASGVNGDELYYGSEEIIAEIKGEDGWYDKGTLIPEGDKRFYKTETGSVLQEVNAGTGVYTWLYGSNAVSANADDTSAIKTAQNKALGWLNADGYKEEPTAEEKSPYKVSARKVEDTKSKEYTKTYIFGKEKWENGANPEKDFADLVKSGYTKYSEVLGDKYDVWFGGYSIKVVYTYKKLSTPLAITPDFATSPAGHYWTWNGVKYDSQDALISALRANGWQAEKDGTTVRYYRNVKLTNSELLDQGYEHRLYSERTVTVPASNKALAVSAVFTNSFEKRESITVQKVIHAEEGRDVANETYSYQVERYDSENGYQQFNDYTIKAGAGTTASHDSENGIFTITGAGSVELIIDETIKNGLFRIKETDQGTADEVKWTDSNSEYSKLLKNGDTAVCTNSYYNNTLTIAKILSADSYEAAPEKSKIFTFTVALTDKNGTPLSQVGYQTADGVSFGSDVDTNNHVISLTNGEFTFMMKAGGTLVLEKIPSEAQYTVTEKSFSDEEYENYYTVELVSTKKNEEAPQVSIQANPVSKTVSGNFSENGSTAANRDQKVEYTNKITPIRTNITVNKLITDKNGSSITDDGDGETFIFEITNIDPMSPGHGEKFYASVITNGGSGSMTIHNVFAGVYSVEEMKHMRFKPVAGTMAEVNTVKESGAVEFKNYRSSSEYFSDSKAAINKVDEKGFTRTSSEDSGKSSIKPVELPPAMLKHDEILFGEGSFDSEDIPYYG